jgi:squalene-hopene/tetraprenyl-beta-curcumene cyclase
VDAVNADGGVGAAPGLPSTIEETALAVEALARVAVGSADAALRERAAAAAERGVEWLVEHTAGGTKFPAAPIGLYFAKLWYDEELYPLAFTVAALERSATV